MKLSAALRLLVILGSCLTANAAVAAQFPSKAGPLSVVTVAKGLEHPWGLAFLPDGRMLVSERPGRLRLVDPDGRVSQPIAGVPRVYARGEGGLLDVALDPDFAANHLIYFAFAEPGAGGAATSVARARLADDRLEQLQVIFRQRPKVDGATHFGARLLFLKDGTLIVTLGERDHRELIADLKSDLGKIVRINPDGTIPRDNPFVGKAGWKPEIWTTGHRNPLGLTIDPTTGQMWETEFGPDGGDEVNLIEKGAQYGWIEVTQGKHYNNEPAKGVKNVPGMTDPVLTYLPESLNPGNPMFYDGAAFPAWKGDFLLPSFTKGLLRYDTQGGKPVGEPEYLLGDLKQRLRDVRAGPNGELYILTDETDGALLKVTPGS
jgi:glucose/arabinose dehydrogenase